MIGGPATPRLKIADTLDTLGFLAGIIGAMDDELWSLERSAEI